MQTPCHKCQANFEITQEDLTFYDKISPVFDSKKHQIPSPALCAQCRYKRRLSFRNERNLHQRKCDATGKQIVSIFSPDKSSPTVYSQDYWWSDKWDAKEYGRDFDFNRPFFEQWGELFKEVPQLALNNNKSENCEFTNQCENNKNCYLLISGSGNEDCLFSMWLYTCKDLMDCLYMSKGELCYEVVNGENCYHCTHSQNLENCSDCHFSLNCIGCSDCIGCVNLRNKQYYIFNEPYSPEKYKQKLKELKLDTHSGINSLKKQIAEFALKFPQKFYHGSKTEKFSGDYLYELKNTINSYNCRYSENIKYCQDAWEARNCYDITETLDNDFCYELEGCAYNNNAVFCMKLQKVHDAYYSSHCFYSKNLFGCVGLKNAQYHILNKKYSKEKYEKLVSKIIDHMKKTKEWGKPFPSHLSQFGYNETVAQEYFPLTKEEALNRGFSWSDYESPAPSAEKIIPSEELPDSISEVQDDILNYAIKCEVSGKPFKIIPQELAFYRKHEIPIPRKHHDIRHKERMALRNPRKLWDRECAKCGTEIQTTYAPERPEMVYCEACYLKEVY